MTDWWRGAVLYQIYPRSFADSDGDGIGDLRGITGHLDHVASLGVDGIWLSPVFASPMDDFGYDVAGYCDIDPLFGTLADFRALLARAHALGLRVVLDQVYSHSSDRCTWFAESRRDRTNAKADWYVWADPKPDGTPPNNWLAAFGGAAWSWEPRRRQYYLHNFLPSQPDLNLHNGEVQETILDVARFWLDLGVDGFRLDVANYYMHDRALRDNPPRPGHAGPRAVGYQQRIHNISQPENLAFLARLRAVLDSYEGRMAVAEITCEQQLARVAEYTAGGKLLHTAYSFALLGGAMDGAALRETIAAVLDAPGEPWPSWALSNHDVPRVASRWAAAGEAEGAAAPVLLALLLMLRGTVFLYQGEELGLPQAELPREALRDPEAINHWPFGAGRDGARTPMPWHDAAGAGFTGGVPWLPIDARHRALSVARQEGDAASMLELTRRLLALRRALPGFGASALAWLAAPDAVLAFDRMGAGWRLRCLFNLSPDAAVTLPHGMEAVMEGRGWRCEGGTVRLAPRGFAIGRDAGRGGQECAPGTG
jgi:alpha-glucosidase